MHLAAIPFLRNREGRIVMVLPTCPGCVDRDRTIARLQRRITHLERRLDKLEAENRRLREQLDEARREVHRQTTPFRRRHLKLRQKKPGRRKGHAPANRPTPPPERIDRVIDVPCRRCPDCQADLVDPGVVIQYQTDLPPIVPIVTQFNIETGYCPCCRLYCQGRHPEQVSDAIGAAGNTLGPVALTMAAELKHRLGVPYRKICDFFSTYCDLTICPATLVRAEQRLTDLALPTYDLLIEALRRAEVVHADETGWRIGRLNAWLWVFSNQDATVYAIRHSRGHEVPEAILGPDFDGWLIVDGFAAYTVLEYAKGQCNGHLLRRAKNLRDQVPEGEVPLLDELSHLLQEAIDLAQRRTNLTETGYRRRVAELEQRVVAWVLAKPKGCSDHLRRLHQHLCNHITEWFVFLHEPEVPATNNHAERMLRPAVITRKVGGCNKSLLGSLAHSVLASIMVTCKQQGQKFLELARRLWQGGEPQAIPLVPPAEV
jgi:transposase